MIRYSLPIIWIFNIAVFGLMVITPFPGNIPMETSDMDSDGFSVFLPLITSDNWRSATIPLYHIQLGIPSDWNVFEVNRRPEPHRPMDPIVGHDCADYLITSSDGQTIVDLRPTCGYFESIAETWPTDSVIVQDKGNDSWIIRYWDEKQNATVYSQAGVALWGGPDGLVPTRLRQEPPVVSVPGENNLPLMQIDVHCSNGLSCKEPVLTIVDRIVVSLSGY